MEKKFKHRKTGEIITYKDGVIKSGTFVLDMGCEPSSEYWEELKDFRKDYEVLSYKYNNYIYTYTDTPCITVEESKRHYQYHGGVLCESTLHLLSQSPEINSIKRIRDGEVFTVGDEINFNNMGYGKLLEIEFESAPVDKGTGRLCFVNDNIYLGKWWDISQLSKAKPILFKSRDGFDIREGDKVYGVSINWNVFSGVVQKNNLYHREEWKHGKFSTEEAAREYLMWNKPVLSLKDVASIYPGINKNHNAPSHQAEQLKELVKSKL